MVRVSELQFWTVYPLGLHDLLRADVTNRPKFDGLNIYSLPVLETRSPNSRSEQDNTFPLEFPIWRNPFFASSSYQRLSGNCVNMITHNHTASLLLRIFSSICLKYLSALLLYKDTHHWI